MEDDASTAELPLLLQISPWPTRRSVSGYHSIKIVTWQNDKNSYMKDDVSTAELPHLPQISPWPTRRSVSGYRNNSFLQDFVEHVMH
jgi:hypothetical protein